MIFSNKNNLSPVQEMYYGKTKEMEECEVICEEICNIAKSTHAPTAKRTQPLIDEVSNKLKTSLGVKFLYIAMSDKVVTNAYTVPSAFAGVAKGDMENLKRIDASIVQCHITIYSTFIRYADLNGKELMAVILHEIGHCFDKSFRFIISRLPMLIFNNPATAPVSIAKFMYDTTTIRFIMKWAAKPLSNINNFISSMPIIKQVLQFASWIDSRLPNINIIVAPYMLLQVPMAWPIIWAGSMVGAGSEIYADSFAVSYGYGPDLAKALDKLEILPGKKLYRNAMEGKFLTGYSWIETEYNSRWLTHLLAFDGRPISAHRINNIVSKLKRELKDEDIHPKVKALILEDLKNTEAHVALMKDKNYYINRVFVNRYVMNKQILSMQGLSKTQKRSFLDYLDVEKYQD